MSKNKLLDVDVLAPSQVKAYNLCGHSIENVKIDKFGINMEIFDSLIDVANNLSDDIYYGMDA